MVQNLSAVDICYPSTSSWHGANLSTGTALPIPSASEEISFYGT